MKTFPNLLVAARVSDYPFAPMLTGKSAVVRKTFLELHSKTVFSNEVDGDLF